MIQTASAPWAAETREKILDAAERLFAERGIDGVSLREITREAGVNIAAIHYHYGSREGLAKAVLDRVVVPLNEMRIELIDAALAQSGGDPLTLETLLDCFLRPDLITIERLRETRGVAIAHFLGRTYNQPTPFVATLMAQQFAQIAMRFTHELARAVPGVPHDELTWRLNALVGVIVAMFAQATPESIDIELTIARVVAFTAPGFRAPAPRRRRKR